MESSARKSRVNITLYSLNEIVIWIFVKNEGGFKVIWLNPFALLLYLKKYKL